MEEDYSGISGKEKNALTAMIIRGEMDLSSALDRALKEGDESAAKATLALGGESFAESLASIGMMALERAAFGRMTETTEALLRAGVSSDATAFGGMSPLHCAFAGGASTALLAALARAGHRPGPDARGGWPCAWADGGSALAWASQRAWAEGRSLSDEPGRFGRKPWETSRAIGRKGAEAWWAATGRRAEDVPPDGEALALLSLWSGVARNVIAR